MSDTTPEAVEATRGLLALVESDAVAQAKRLLVLLNNLEPDDHSQRSLATALLGQWSALHLGVVLDQLDANSIVLATIRDELRGLSAAFRALAEPTCDFCNGSGALNITYMSEAGEIQDGGTATCPRCAGSGHEPPAATQTAEEPEAAQS